MSQSFNQTDLFPSTPIAGVSFSQRGKLEGQTCNIAGVKVSFKRGDMMQEHNLSAVIAPHSPRQASDRSVMGYYRRSIFKDDMKEFETIHKAQTPPFEYGVVVPTQIKRKNPEDCAPYGCPSYFFNAITVTSSTEPELQFNAIRKGIYNAGWAAVALSDNDAVVNKILTPALGTGPYGHMKGYQSARAIFAGINDFGTAYGKQDERHHIHYTIVIKDDPIHAPMIDEFLQVMQDCSYLAVPPEGEVGKKRFDENRYLDHILLEKDWTNAYDKLDAYTKDYPRYDY